MSKIKVYTMSIRSEKIAWIIADEYMEHFKNDTQGSPLIRIIELVSKSEYDKLESSLKKAVEALELVIADSSKPLKLAGYFISDETHYEAELVLKELRGEK